MKLVTEHELNTRTHALHGYIKIIENTNEVDQELEHINRQINGINAAIDFLKNVPEQELGNTEKDQEIKRYQAEREKLAAKKFELLNKTNPAAPSPSLATPSADPNSSPATPSAGARVAPSAPQASPTKPKPDPNVLKLQQKLNSFGANLRVDGIMGPKTRAAQQQYQNQLTPPAKSAPKNAQPASTVNGNYPSQPQTQSSYAAPPAGNYPNNPRTSRFPPSSKYTTRPAQSSSDVDRALGAFAATESVSYNEDQTLARIIGLAGL